MRAFILNSGIGKRMGELTQDKPKCLVRINGKSILERQLELLCDLGIKRIVITTGPFEDKIKDLVSSYDLEVEFYHNPRYAETNYIYSMYLAKEAIDDDVLLMHGDMVLERDVLVKLVESHVDNGVLVNKEIRLPEKDFKARIIGEDVKQIGVDVFGEDCFFLAPVYKFGKKSFLRWMQRIEDYVKKANTRVYAENALNEILEEISVKPVYYKGFCMEVDDPDDLKIAKEKLR